MTLREGQRVRLTGRAWGYASQNREVYARVTFANGGFAKIDEQVVTSSGLFVEGYEVEDADRIDYETAIQRVVDEDQAFLAGELNG